VKGSRQEKRPNAQRRGHSIATRGWNNSSEKNWGGIPSKGILFPQTQTPTAAPAGSGGRQFTPKGRSALKKEDSWKQGAVPKRRGGGEKYDSKQLFPAGVSRADSGEGVMNSRKWVGSGAGWASRPRKKRSGPCLACVRGRRRRKCAKWEWGTRGSWAER